MNDPAWTWRYEDAEGTALDPGVPGASSGFAAQVDAESWLGESWAALLAAGVAQVWLLRSVVPGPDDAPVAAYGPLLLPPR